MAETLSQTQNPREWLAFVLVWGAATLVTATFCLAAGGHRLAWTEPCLLDVLDMPPRRTLDDEAGSAPS